MSGAFDATLDAALDTAASRLSRGALVAFPTETVYGLGADASSADAVARIFAAKGRPSDHPLIVHVDADPLPWVRDLPSVARTLIDRFWPGPLTLILPRRPGLGEAAAGGQDSIGLRSPSHPLARELLARFAALKRGEPAGVAAPSANRFGRVSPTRAQHVLDEFADASPIVADATIFVIDGGDSPVGIESTIVDCSRLDRVGPVLLRPGAITAAMIADAIGREALAPDDAAPRASGTLDAHYAPMTPVVLVDGAALDAAGDDVVVWTWSADVLRPRWQRAPHDATDYAHVLYATLRALDAERASAIWIERPPRTAAWAGINDRLARAAAASR